MTSSTTIYLISGASRGIGLDLVSNILANDDQSFVYAGARNVTEASPPQLKSLQAKYPDRMAIIQCVSADEEGNKAMAKEIEERHGRVDVVIANAAISVGGGMVAETPLSAMDEHFRINVLGPLALFQATYDLLKNSHTFSKGASLPRFITISSGVGALQGTAVEQKHIGILPYACSKAALNWMTRKIHFENEWIVAFPITPGPVKTEMLIDNISSDKTGSMKPFLDIAIEPSQAANLLRQVITASKRDTHGGQFFDRNGAKVEW